MRAEHFRFARQNPPGAIAMYGSKNTDVAITQQVNNKLAGRGIRSPCHVGVQTQEGNVTLSGTVQYAHQKTAAVQVASGVTGVRRVADQLTVKPSDQQKENASTPGRT
jgi:osmotically-inducible protein OsmY